MWCILGVVLTDKEVTEQTSLLDENLNVQEAQLLLRDCATFVSFENVAILSSE